MIHLYRQPILDVAHSQRAGMDVYTAGPLRAKFLFIRIPVRVAQWVNRVVLR